MIRTERLMKGERKGESVGDARNGERREKGKGVGRFRGKRHDSLWSEHITSRRHKRRLNGGVRWVEG